jgi:hypothetical protein
VLSLGARAGARASPHIGPQHFGQQGDFLSASLCIFRPSTDLCHKRLWRQPAEAGVMGVFSYLSGALVLFVLANQAMYFYEIYRVPPCRPRSACLKPALVPADRADLYLYASARASLPLPAGAEPAMVVKNIRCVRVYMHAQWVRCGR